MEANATSPTSSVTELSRKAWTAYATLGFILLIIVSLVEPFMRMWSSFAGHVFVSVSLTIAAYQATLIRSCRLYYDDDGIWLYYGVFPWQKGITGVKWRDLDEAVFTAGFFSWLFRSYTIRIGHRFTKSSEIHISYMTQGREVVGQINAKHQAMIRASTSSMMDVESGSE